MLARYAAGMTVVIFVLFVIFVLNEIVPKLRDAVMQAI